MVYEYKGKQYLLLNRNGMIQVDDEWIPSVVYTNDTGIWFTRTASDFNSKFKLVK